MVRRAVNIYGWFDIGQKLSTACEGQCIIMVLKFWHTNNKAAWKSEVLVSTVNGERFAGLNFRIFHGFQEHRESFPVNVYKLCIMALLKYCKV